MCSMTRDDYIKLYQELINDQYGSDDDLPENIEWIPSEPDIKKKISLPNVSGMIDLSDAKKAKILASIHKCSNLQVNDFIIKITSYHGKPNDKHDAEVSLNISIYENKKQIHLGRISNMVNKVNILKDTRFINRPWLQNFSSYGGQNISLDQLCDIIRWMQALKKMSAFI